MNMKVIFMCTKSSAIIYKSCITLFVVRQKTNEKKSWFGNGWDTVF